jgi:hypothetical protein
MNARENFFVNYLIERIIFINLGKDGQNGKHGRDGLQGPVGY